MQEFWGTFEIIALAVLFVLQIYFLIIALRKMKMMGDFFPDIRSIHIKRIAVDEKGNEIRLLKEEKEVEITEEEPAKKSVRPSVSEMRKMNVIELRSYAKYIRRAYYSRTASEYCVNPEYIVESKDAIAVIKSSYNDYSDFKPAKIFTIEEFKRIMSLPNVYADKLFEVVESGTNTSNHTINILSPGRCKEDGSRWIITNKCKIEI